MTHSEVKKEIEVVEIPITVKVDRQQLEDLITSAIEGGRFGIEYWCPKVRLRVPDQGFDPAIDIVKTDRRAGEHWHCYIARNVLEGGTLTFYENQEEWDDSKWVERTLTRENLLAGVGRFIAEREAAGGASCDKETGVMDYDFDAPDADVILQLALLGEVVYG